MIVTVFGATGGVGSQVVGELSAAAAIDRAVQGANAVVSALGPSLSRRATGLPLVEGTRNIVAAMQRHGVPATSATAPLASSTRASDRPGRPGCRPSWRRHSCAAPTTNSSA